MALFNLQKGCAEGGMALINIIILISLYALGREILPSPKMAERNVDHSPNSPKPVMTGMIPQHLTNEAKKATGNNRLLWEGPNKGLAADDQKPEYSTTLTTQNYTTDSLEVEWECYE